MESIVAVVQQWVSSGSLALAAGGAFAGGVLAGLCPCVIVMVPLLIGFIGGMGEMTTKRSFLSPFYYLGPYGKKPYFYSSPLLLTAQQCEDAAAAQLAKLSGATESATRQGVVDPRLEAYDVFWLKRDRVGGDTAFMIDSLHIPLTAEGSMSAVGRTVIGAV